MQLLRDNLTVWQFEIEENATKQAQADKREETFKATGTAKSIFGIDEKSSLCKKIKELVIG